jgi:hypothetical protein
VKEINSPHRSIREGHERDLRGKSLIIEGVSEITNGSYQQIGKQEERDRWTGFK